MNEKLKVYLIKINYEIQKNTLKEFLNISIINHCMKYLFRTQRFWDAQ